MSVLNRFWAGLGLFSGPWHIETMSYNPPSPWHPLLPSGPFLEVSNYVSLTQNNHNVPVSLCFRDIHPSNKSYCSLCCWSWQLQVTSQVKLNVLLFLLTEMLDPLQENSQRIPTGREENIKCNKVLNATSLTCMLYLRNSFLGISLTLPGNHKIFAEGWLRVPPLEHLVRFPAPRW